MIYELSIVTGQPLFTDEDKLVDNWSDYLGIQLEPHNLIKTITNIDIVNYADNMLMISQQKIKGTDMFYTFYYSDTKNRLSIQLNYE